MEKTVIAECGEALAAIRYDEIQAYLDAILKAEKVFFVGVGRVLLALQCIAKRYAIWGYGPWWWGRLQSRPSRIRMSLW